MHFSNIDQCDSVIEFNVLNNNADAHSKRQQNIKRIVKENKLIELYSEYYGMDSYYYSKEKQTMYKVCNACRFTNDVTPQFEISQDKRILELNNLPR